MKLKELTCYIGGGCYYVANGEVEARNIVIDPIGEAFAHHDCEACGGNCKNQAFVKLDDNLLLAILVRFPKLSDDYGGQRWSLRRAEVVRFLRSLGRI